MHYIGNLAWYLVIQLVLFVVVALAAFLTAPLWGRWIFQQAFRDTVRRLFQEPYTENIVEGMTAVRKFGIQWVMENELRSHEGMPLAKPIGTTRQFPHFDGLLFSPVQLRGRVLDHQESVVAETVIGKHANRPMVLSMPIMVSAMGYGVALSKPFVRALMKGAAISGTASNSGQGPWLPEFRQLSKHLVVQIHAAPWHPPEEALRSADMIEIRFGQGANAGCGTILHKSDVTPEIAGDLGVRDAGTQGAYIPAGIPGVRDQRSLRRYVSSLRIMSQGCPIAIKLAAGNNLEIDLQIAVSAGVDVIVIDGAQAGTQSSPAILVDDFGLPTLPALCRAQRFLLEKGWRNRVDLVISGGLRTPGDMLKALALGADAVYVGTAALFATTHTQIIKTIPFEPPTSLAWAKGGYRHLFDEDEGTQCLHRFLTSCVEEMKVAARALGKTSLHDISASDLVAWDPEVARITGLPLV